jgi:hypothetical protein
MYAAMRVEMERNGGDAFMPEIGTPLHWWAERMVKEGLLERGPGGIHYTLPRGRNLNPYGN